MSTPPTDATPATPAPSANAATERLAHRYDATLAGDIERRWQAAWTDAGSFRTPNPDDAGFDATRPKFYCLDMFPYPSGAGLHVGHPEGYTATDILCRFKRMRGFNVLHPMGWDAFGLPAEQYAIRTGVHPAETTRTAIDTFRGQLQRFGFSYDWDREFATIDEDYYRWTQWIWLKCYGSFYDPRTETARPIEQLGTDLAAGSLVLDEDRRAIPAPGSEPDSANAKAKASPPPPLAGRQWSDLNDAERRTVLDDHRLAYLGEQTVNWCPKLGTALANEEVINGRSERGSHPVLRKPLRQWMFRITAYAERLLQDIDTVKWPESTRVQQREWIGRSEGADVDFAIADPPAGATAGAAPAHLRVYTTRPDTIFGATYMVIAPEHPLVEAMLADPQAATDTDAIRTYVDVARNRADVDRMTDGDEKTGVFTGFHAVNPATGQSIPIWIADYVLMGYGTGAIMAVPAHDERDMAFARRFELPIVTVVQSRAQRSIHACVVRLADSGIDPDRWLDVVAEFVGTSIDRDAGDDDAVWDLVTSGGGSDGAPQSPIAREWKDTLQSMVDGAGIDADAFFAAVRERRLEAALGEATSEPGFAVNCRSDSVNLDGLSTRDAKEAAIDWVERSGHGRRRVNFRLRDWLFSRQRYWGEPFPVVYTADGTHHPIDAAHLPVALPDLADYEPAESEDPAPLLAKAADWVETTAGAAGVSPDVLPPDTPVRRETNTMPGWAGSCWYYLRYCDHDNNQRFVGNEAERYWMISPRDGAATTGGVPELWDAERDHHGGVDLYVGGAEHAVLHLLYARFWHKVLFDLGEVSTPEPFGRLFHQGLITAYAYQRADRVLVPTDEVEERDGGFVEIATGERVTQVTAKMSKSLRNVVNPDDVIAEYGADTFRLYEMYMGPLEASKPWNTQDIAGPYRFLQRAWRLCIDEATGAPRIAEQADDELETLLHRTIAKVADDIERLAFNTGIAAMIEFVNVGTKRGPLGRDQLERFATILAPFAPHLGEEIWSRLGHTDLICDQPWPVVDDARLRDDTIEMPVQINGKVRGRISIAADADREATEAQAMADARVQELVAGMTVRKVIVVPGKIVNIIAG
ncbi:MAG: leucine--tRNA ligase [Phycisphaerales bacterium]